MQPRASRWSSTPTFPTERIARLRPDSMPASPLSRELADLRDDRPIRAQRTSFPKPRSAWTDEEGRIAEHERRVDFTHLRDILVDFVMLRAAGAAIPDPSPRRISPPAVESPDGW